MPYRERKIGRNDKCPCGSGKKYKKCHLNVPDSLSPDKAAQIFQQMEAREHQRKKQQGLGREIISADFQGNKVVAVGNRVHYSKKWKTFHDFLEDFLKQTLGIDWGQREMQKAFEERHPVVQWYGYWGEHRRKNTNPSVNGITYAAHIGASMAYLNLAYNFYLLAHNKGIQTELIRRVKLDDPPNFHGAVYETYVAAYFVKAGFDLEFENELDGSTTHCEFTATHKDTGRQFSVEAKVLLPKAKGKPNIIKPLNKALAKEANHERIVFIDIGKPAYTPEESKTWLLAAQKRLRELEDDPRLNGQNHPPAYVIFTNNSFWYDLQGDKFASAALGEGFKIPSFKIDHKDTVRNALKDRDRHNEVLLLMDSMRDHQEIPVTFDGENPELAFAPPDENPPLIIGKQYLIPSDEGDAVGTLRHVVVDESTKIAIGSYDLATGGSRLLSCPMSDIELAAYKHHPDTFFGKVLPKKEIKDPLEFYDWIYNSYRNTPKERLLEFMKDWSNLEELKHLPQEELVRLYAEGATEAATPSADDSAY